MIFVRFVHIFMCECLLRFLRFLLLRTMSGEGFKIIFIKKFKSSVCPSKLLKTLNKTFSNIALQVKSLKLCIISLQVLLALNQKCQEIIKLFQMSNYHLLKKLLKYTMQNILRMYPSLYKNIKQVILLCHLFSQNHLH